MNANTAVSAELAQEEAVNAQLQAAQNQAAIAAETNQMLAMTDNTLDIYYNEIRDAQGLGQLVCLWGSQCEVNFWAALSQQALGEDSLESTLGQQKAEATYHSVTNSYTYTDAKKQLDELVFAPYGADVQSSDSDEVKITKILGFIDSHIQYAGDLSETPHAPGETLALRSGDCKDYSILTSAALADAGIPSAVMWMDNIPNPSGSDHAMILIQSNENMPLYESYSDLTSYGLPAGRWWVIEPQYTLPQQLQNPQWFAQLDGYADWSSGRTHDMWQN